MHVHMCMHVYTYTLTHNYTTRTPYRYLVDVRWMKQWKKYVGYDQDQSSAGLDSAHPGPIDNSNLFKGTCTFDRFICIARPNAITHIVHIIRSC